MQTEEYGNQFAIKLYFENITVYLDEELSGKVEGIPEDQLDLADESNYVYYPVLQINGRYKIDFNVPPVDHSYIKGRQEDPEIESSKTEVSWADLYPSDQEFLQTMAKDSTQLFLHQIDGQLALALEVDPVLLD